MKRIIFTLLIASMVVNVSGQTEFDVLKYIQPDITGSARYSSMAGAFGALGGDPSAIKDNPAGLGIYRSSEFSASFNSLTQNTTSNWGNSATDGLYKLGMNNFSFVISSLKSGGSSTGLVRSNWAFSYNRLKDYNRNLRVNGGSKINSSITDYMAYFTGDIYGEDLYDVTDYNPYNNTAVPWISVLAANAGLMNEMIDANTNETLYWESMLDPGETVAPRYALNEQGYFNEYALSWSGNFENKFFLGATVNFHDINYRLATEYSEAFEGPSGGNMSLINVLKTSGAGIGLKLGTIYAPLDFLRLGASLQTPVIYNISDIHYADMKYYYGANNSGVIKSPEGTDEFHIQSPLIYNLSASFIFGKQGVIGIEYVNSRNSGAKMLNLDNSTNSFQDENDGISELFNNQQTFKIGGEYKLNTNFALRAGYAYTDPATSSLLGKQMIPNTTRTDVDYFIHNGTQYFTAGIGYRAANWYLDVALMKRVMDESFYPYNSTKLSPNLAVSPASVENVNMNIIATIGFKL